MQEKNIVMIGDNSLSFAVAVSGQLEKAGVQTIKVEKDVARLFENILVNHPKIIVLDTILQNGEVITLIDRVREIEGYDPTIIVVECYKQENAINPILGEKIDLFISHPVNIAELCKKIISIANVDISPQTTKINVPSVVDLTNLQDDLEVAVTEVILLIGIPAHVKGYQFIRCAIINCIETPNMLNSVTKILYPTVAKEFNTTSSRVERAIRHAIEIAWDRGDIDTLNSYFGYTINNQRGKPTNSEFIAMVSDKLRLKYKHILAKSVTK